VALLLLTWNCTCFFTERY